MTEETDGAFSLNEVFEAARRRIGLMLKLGVPIALFGTVLSQALPDVYSSTATFELVQGNIKESQTQTDTKEQSFADQYVYRLADRVRRSSQLRDLVAELSQDPDLAGKAGATLDDVGSDTAVAMITTGVLDTWSGRERAIYAGFTVSYYNPSPEVAYQVASRLAPLFPQLSRVTDQERASHDLAFYTSEAERTRQQIAEQESRLAEFKEKNYNRLPEVAQANLNQREGTERELVGVESELRVLQRNRVFTAQQLDQARAGPPGDNLRQLEAEYARKSAVYSSGHPDVIALRRQIDTLQRRGPAVGGSSRQAELEAQRAALAEARQRYSEDHPDVRSMKRRVEALGAQIAAGESTELVGGGDTVMSVQFQTQLNALDTQIAGLAARRDQLRSRLAQFELRLGSTPEVERDYQAITRNLGAARQQYEQLINRRMDAEVVASAIEAGAADRFRLLDPPRIPESAARPARTRILFLSFVLAVVVAVSSVVVAEILDSSVRGVRDVRVALGVSPLVAVPLMHGPLHRRKRALSVATYAGSALVGAGLLYVLIRAVTA